MNDLRRGDQVQILSLTSLSDYIYVFMVTQFTGHLPQIKEHRALSQSRALRMPEEPRTAGLPSVGGFRYVTMAEARLEAVVTDRLAPTVQHKKELALRLA